MTTESNRQMPTTRLLPTDEQTTFLVEPRKGKSLLAPLADLANLADSAYASRGWDQNYQMFAAAPLSAKPKKHRDRLAAAAKANGHDLDPAMVALSVVPIPGKGKVLELIGGCRVPPWVHILVLTLEAWAAPMSEAGLAPSMHPDRVETRMTIAVANTGSLVRIMTPRGGSSTVSTGNAARHPYGDVVDALLRLLGASTAPSRYFPGHLTAASLLRALQEWVHVVQHPVGTPAVRSLALTLSRVGAGSGHINSKGVQPASIADADAFVGILGPGVAGLLVDTVATADGPSGHLTSPLTPGRWEDAVPLWEGCARSGELAWMDAGMFARAAMSALCNGSVAVDLLYTVGVALGKSDAQLLQAGLGTYGLLGWPAWDQDTPSPINPATL
jgi:hypothetical protein